MTRVPAVDAVEVRVLADGTFRVVPSRDVHLQNALGEDGVADMCNLNHLHEASILANIRVRFFSEVRRRW